MLNSDTEYKTKAPCKRVAFVRRGELHLLGRDVTIRGFGVDCDGVYYAKVEVADSRVPENPVGSLIPVIRLSYGFGVVTVTEEYLETPVDMLPPFRYVIAATGETYEQV